MLEVKNCITVENNPQTPNYDALPICLQNNLFSLLLWSHFRCPYHLTKCLFILNFHLSLQFFNFVHSPLLSNDVYNSKLLWEDVSLPFPI